MLNKNSGKVNKNLMICCFKPPIYILFTFIVSNPPHTQIFFSSLCFNTQYFAIQNIKLNQNPLFSFDRRYSNVT